MGYPVRITATRTYVGTREQWTGWYVTDSASAATNHVGPFNTEGEAKSAAAAAARAAGMSPRNMEAPVRGPDEMALLAQAQGREVGKAPPKECPDCSGTGIEWDARADKFKAGSTCPTCKGTGNDPRGTGFSTMDGLYAGDKVDLLNEGGAVYGQGIVAEVRGTNVYVKVRNGSAATPAQGGYGWHPLSLTRRSSNSFSAMAGERTGTTVLVGGQWFWRRPNDALRYGPFQDASAAAADARAHGVEVGMEAGTTSTMGGLPALTPAQRKEYEARDSDAKLAEWLKSKGSNMEAPTMLQGPALCPCGRPVQLERGAIPYHRATSGGAQCMAAGRKVATLDRSTGNVVLEALLLPCKE